MTPKPFVSILTPTYNRRAFLPALIYCYTHQTYPLTKMEWIILDDGTDSVKDIFSPLAKTIPNLRYYRIPEKLSIGAKRNKLNDLAKGEICIAMDDDDFYFPDRVTHVVHKFQGNPAVELAGTSELYYYFHDLQLIYRFGPIHKQHATNGTLAYRATYKNTHRYDESVSHGEEPSFLDEYRNPMIQLDPLKTMLVMCHKYNTYDKHQMIDTNPLMKKTAFKLKQFIRDAVHRDMYVSILPAVQKEQPQVESKEEHTE
jgi:glycosyltransferase involved in cell wall biosynthesis